MDHSSLSPKISINFNYGWNFQFFLNENFKNFFNSVSIDDASLIRIFFWCGFTLFFNRDDHRDKVFFVEKKRPEETYDQKKNPFVIIVWTNKKYEKLSKNFFFVENKLFVIIIINRIMVDARQTNSKFYWMEKYFG